MLTIDYEEIEKMFKKEFAMIKKMSKQNKSSLVQEMRNAVLYYFEENYDNKK